MKIAFEIKFDRLIEHMMYHSGIEELHNRMENEVRKCVFFIHIQTLKVIIITIKMS